MRIIKEMNFFYNCRKKFYSAVSCLVTENPITKFMKKNKYFMKKSLGRLWTGGYIKFR